MWNLKLDGKIRKGMLTLFGFRTDKHMTDMTQHALSTSHFMNMFHCYIGLIILQDRITTVIC